MKKKWYEDIRSKQRYFFPLKRMKSDFNLYSGIVINLTLDGYNIFNAFSDEFSEVAPDSLMLSRVCIKRIFK